MYSSIKRSSQMGSERRIVIDEVNPAQRFITGHDSYSKPYRVTFDFQDPLLAIPSTGEMWTIKQYANEWRLDRRVETGQETTPVTELTAGDRRIEATNDLYLNGQHILLNNQDLLAIIADLQERLTTLELDRLLALEDGT